MLVLSRSSRHRHRSRPSSPSYSDHCRWVNRSVSVSARRFATEAAGKEYEAFVNIGSKGTVSHITMT